MPNKVKRIWNFVVAGEVIWSLVTTIPVGGVITMLLTLDLAGLWVIPVAIIGLVLYVFLAAYALRRMRLDTEERLKTYMEKRLEESQSGSISNRVARFWNKITTLGRTHP